MNARIWPAMSLPVTVSMPSSPGEEFTSMISGPLSLRRRSTPATLRPTIFAARTAMRRSSGVMRMISAVPPRCRLERNSPSLAVRFMAATTLSPITKQRMSEPPASLMNSCTRKCARSPRKAAESVSDAVRGLRAHFLVQEFIKEVRPQSAEGIDDGFRRLARLGQHHAHALGALEQLDHHRRAADEL